MDQRGPTSWPAGAYETAYKMWLAGATPVSIAAACGVTEDALYHARKRHQWPERGFHGKGRFIDDAELAQMGRDWIAGVSINTMQATYKIGSGRIARLADENDWPERDLAREALPAGHPDMWALICRGSSLEGVAYPN